MNLPKIKELNNRIMYIDASEEPLSSHVGIVQGDSALYLYDVGATLENLDFLNGLSGKPFDIVVSHFHADHTWWLTRHREGDKDLKPGDVVSTSYVRPEYRSLYVSAQTAKYTCRREPDGEGCVAGTVSAAEDKSGHDIILRQDERIVINDGVRIEIIPMPSTHAKGCLAMMVDDEYLFMGDASYGMRKDGRVVFNAQLLKEEIELLESLTADKLLLSHERRFVRPKEVVLRQLKAIYVKREKSDPYITV